MTNLAPPVTVYRNTMDCGNHEITLYTDGYLRAYAHGNQTDATVSHRDREYVWVTCGQPLHNDEPCEISLGFDLTEPGTWTTDPDAIRLVSKYGEDVVTG